jgi:hypothetical protein
MVNLTIVITKIILSLIPCDGFNIWSRQGLHVFENLHKSSWSLVFKIVVLQQMIFLKVFKFEARRPSHWFFQSNLPLLLSCINLLVSWLNEGINFLRMTNYPTFLYIASSAWNTMSTSMLSVFHLLCCFTSLKYFLCCEWILSWNLLSPSSLLIVYFTRIWSCFILDVRSFLTFSWNN